MCSRILKIGIVGLNMKNKIDQLIPSERQQEFNSAVKSIFGDLELQKIQILDGGSLSQIYKIKIDNKSYVVRMMDLEDSLTLRENQIKCMNAAFKMGIAPTCHYSDAHTGLIIMDYIQAQPIVVSEKWLKELGSLLRQLHSFKDFPQPHQPLFDYMQELVKSFREMSLAPMIDDYLTQFDQVISILSPHLTLASCHNDLNCKNLLFKDKIYFIDWEAAGMEDPFFDLATLCNEFMTSELQQHCFLSSYFDTEPTPEQEAKLLLMRQVSYCYLALHYLLHAVEGGLKLTSEDIKKSTVDFSDWIDGYKSKKFELTSAADFLKYGLMQIQTSINQMKTEQFKLAKIALGESNQELSISYI